MVANAVKDGITYYEYENIKKNYFVAVATEDPSDNWGLPFWLGKVVQKKEQCTELRAEDHSEEEELEDGVLVEEYAQSQRRNMAVPDGTSNTNQMCNLITGNSKKNINTVCYAKILLLFA